MHGDLTSCGSVPKSLRESADSLRQSLGVSSGTPSEFRKALGTLGDTVERYLQEVSKLLDLTEEGRLDSGSALLNDMLRPLRHTIRLELDRMREAEQARLEARRQQLNAEYNDMNRNLLRLGAVIVVLIGAIAIYTVVRLRKLEYDSRRQAAELAANRDELRKLSQGLVAAQESERKQLSRDLHDQVGQILTALRMEVGNLGDLHHQPGPPSKIAAVPPSAWPIKLCNRSAIFRWGCGPACWTTSASSRPSVGRPAISLAAPESTSEVRIEGDLDSLPERYRIHAYRIVQESLTNIARHAAPTRS